jgi:hypothetical protein
LRTGHVVALSAPFEFEILSILEHVLQKIGTHKIYLAAALTSDDMRDRMKPWLEDFGIPDIELINLATSTHDLKEARDRLYADSRERQINPLGPIWIMERAFGPPPEHLRERFKLDE